MYIELKLGAIWALTLNTSSNFPHVDFILSRGCASPDALFNLEPLNLVYPYLYLYDNHQISKWDIKQMGECASLLAGWRWAGWAHQCCWRRCNSLMPRSHIMLLPYGRHTVLRSTVCKMWLQGDREATVRHPHSCCSYQKFAVWSLYKHRKAAVWFSRHPRQRKKTYITSRPLQAPPRTVTVWWPCSVCAVLRYLKKSLMPS